MKNYESDKDQVINALGKGRSFIVNNYYGAGKGFKFVAEYDGLNYTMEMKLSLIKAKIKK